MNMERRTDDLQYKKLQLEIIKLSTPWYRNIEFWKVVIPTLAVLLSLYFAFGKGIIDHEKTRLEIQKEQLKLEVLQFQIQKIDIQKGVDSIYREKGRLTEQLSRIQFSKDSILSKYNQVAQHLSSLNKENKYLHLDQQAQKDFYISRIKGEYSLREEYLIQLNASEKLVKVLEVDNAKLTAQNNFFNKRIELSNKDVEEINMLTKESVDSVQKRLINRTDKLIKLNQLRLQKTLKEIEKMKAPDIERWFELRYGQEESRDGK